MEDVSYIDPAEWSALLDEITTELESLSSEPLTAGLAQLKGRFIYSIRQAARAHFQSSLKIHKICFDALCSSQTLALVERYFSREDIADFFKAGYLFLLRKYCSPLHFYPTIQKLTTMFDVLLLEKLKAEMTETVNSYNESSRKEKTLIRAHNRAKVKENPDKDEIERLKGELEKLPVVTVKDTQSKIIKFILDKIQRGLDINALGRNGRGLLHELMHLNIPDAFFCSAKESIPELGLALSYLADDPMTDTQMYSTLIDFLSSSRFFGIDWSLRDVNGNTVLHHAVDCEKSEDVQKAFYENKRCYVGALNNEGELAFARGELDFETKSRLHDKYKIPPADFGMLAKIYTMKRNMPDDGYFRDQDRSQLRCQLGNIFSTLERVIPETDFVTLVGIDTTGSKKKEISLLNVLQPLLAGNWDLLTRYPKVVRAFFDYFQTLWRDDYSSYKRWVQFVSCLAQECIDRGMDNKCGDAERIRAQILGRLEKMIVHAMERGDRMDSPTLELLMTLFSKMPHKMVVELCETKDKHDQTFLSYLQSQVGLQSLVNAAPCAEMIMFLVKHSVDVLSLFMPGIISLLRFACIYGHYEMAVCLVKYGAPVLTEREKTGCASVLLSLPGKEKECERLAAFIEHQMGMSLEMYRNFTQSQLIAYMTAKQFSTLDKERQRILIYEGREHAVKYLLDSAIQIKHLLTWPTKWVLGLMRKGFRLREQSDEMKAFKKEAFTIAVCRISAASKHTFFATAQRDIVCRIVAHASPNCLSIEEGHFFASRMFPRSSKEKHNERSEFIGQLKVHIKGGQGNLMALGYLCEALSEPAEEIIEVVESYRTYYETWEDDRFKELFKSCLAVVNADKEKLHATRLVRK